MRWKDGRKQRGLRHRRLAEHQQQIGEARSGLQIWCYLSGASKSDLWLSVRGASAEEFPRQQASLEWLGHVRSVTHYGEGDKLGKHGDADGPVASSLWSEQ